MKFLFIILLLTLGCTLNPPSTEKEQIVARALETVFFEVDSTKLSDEAKQIIAENAEVMIKKPGFAFIITGHADPTGSRSYNQELALNRAMAVKAELIENGVPASQLRVKSLGESVPLVTVERKQRNYLNRRVEFETDKIFPITQRAKKIRRASY